MFTFWAPKSAYRPSPKGGGLNSEPPLTLRPRTQLKPRGVQSTRLCNPNLPLSHLFQPFAVKFSRLGPQRCVSTFPKGGEGRGCVKHLTHPISTTTNLNEALRCAIDAPLHLLPSPLTPLSTFCGEIFTSWVPKTRIYLPEGGAGRGVGKTLNLP